MRRLFTILIVIASWPSAGQQGGIASTDKPPAESLIAPYLAVVPDGELYTAEFRGLIERLDKKSKNFNTDHQLLQFLFARVHHTQLKQYSEYTSVASLFKTGTYNCLTATILFSAILDYYSISHEVIETNYHIFILAHTNQGDVLVETTDARDGLVTAPEKIADRIQRYKEGTVQALDEDLAYYQYNFTLFNSVSQNELVGLLYYNLAVESFNRKDIRRAVTHLSQAGDRYISPRIEEFSEILLLAVHQSQLNSEEKSTLKKTLQTIRYKALPVVASIKP